MVLVVVVDESTVSLLLYHSHIDGWIVWLRHVGVPLVVVVVVSDDEWDGRQLRQYAVGNHLLYHDQSPHIPQLVYTCSSRIVMILQSLPFVFVVVAVADQDLLVVVESFFFFVNQMDGWMIVTALHCTALYCTALHWRAWDSPIRISLPCFAYDANWKIFWIVCLLVVYVTLNVALRLNRGSTDTTHNDFTRFFANPTRPFSLIQISLSLYIYI